MTLSYFLASFLKETKNPSFIIPVLYLFLMLNIFYKIYYVIKNKPVEDVMLMYSILI